MANDPAEILSSRCKLLCTCAKSLLDDICARTKSGAIAVDELFMMKKKKEHVELLFAEKSPSEEETRALQQSLQERYEEREEFTGYVKKLGQLCQGVTIHVEGIT